MAAIFGVYSSVLQVMPVRWLFVIPNIEIIFFCSTLKGNGITGEIPPEFGNLTALTSLDLENNRLSGEIPFALGNLQKLQFL